MYYTNEIINTLNTTETKDVINFIKNESSTKDSKIIKLYELLLKKKYTPEEIAIQIYGENKKEAYHSLRKRLTSILFDYISITELRNKGDFDISYQKLMLVSKKLIRNKRFEEGFKILAKAEKHALEENNFLFLNEVYLTQIQNNHYNNQNTLLEFTKKFQNNKILLDQEVKLQLAYAQVKNEIKIFLKEGSTFHVKNIIEMNFKKFEISETTEYNYKTLYQIGQIYFAHALILKDYYSIETYIISQYKKIFRLKNSNKGSLFYQSKLIYLLATLYFQRKEFDESKSYCQKLLEITKRNESTALNAIEFKTIILISLIKHYSGNKEMAIKSLNEYEPKSIDSDKIKLDSLIIQSLFYFHDSDFKKVKSINKKLQETDNYYVNLMGREWLMRKNLIEILLYFELSEFDYSINKIRRFMRNNKNYLRRNNRIKEFMFLVKKICNDPNLIHNTSFHKTLDNNLRKKPRKREDIYILSFFAWIKAKIEKKDLYELTIELVNSLEE